MISRPDHFHKLRSDTTQRQTTINSITVHRQKQNSVGFLGQNGLEDGGVAATRQGKPSHRTSAGPSDKGITPARMTERSLSFNCKQRTGTRACFFKFLEEPLNSLFTSDHKQIAHMASQHDSPFHVSINAWVLNVRGRNHKNEMFLPSAWNCSQFAQELP